MDNLFSELEWRGQVSAATEGARDLLARETRHRVHRLRSHRVESARRHVWCPSIALARLQRFGHAPIALLGGGTGMIGDPSGKTAERSLLSADDVVRSERRSAFEPSCRDCSIRGRGRILRAFVDNVEWLDTMSAMEFLRDVGKYFTVNYLLAKESVKRRLESEDGISFTEFSYSLLQAYDFLVLHDRFNCRLQAGGSDQWGTSLPAPISSGSFEARRRLAW